MVEKNSNYEISKIVRENNEELQDYFRDLERWETDIKKKDEELDRSVISSKESKPIPPIRHSSKSGKESLGSIKMSGEKTKENLNNTGSKSQRIPSHNYEAWAKLDVDNLLKDSESGTDPECDEESENEELENERKKQKAVLEKDKGNEYFKKGKYSEAITCYTRGIHDDPMNAIIPANRAMALMKLGQVAAAEKDCTLSISIDHTYIKAFHRRGTCRLILKKYQLARQDFLKVFEMDPNNKQAQVELEKINEEFKKQDKPKESQQIFVQDSAKEPKMESAIKKSDDAIIFPIDKEIASRSNKPLKRLTIVDIPQCDAGKLASDQHTEKNKKPKSVVSNIISSVTKFNVSETSAPPNPIEPPPNLPPIPLNSFQFERDWRLLRHWPYLQYAYLRNFPPEQFPVMFKSSIETHILTGILRILKDNFNGEVDIYVKYLTELSKVGRFSTIIMFLSDEEKKDICKLIKLVEIKCTAESGKKLGELYHI